MPGPTPALCTFPEVFVQEARDTIRRRTVAVQTVQRFRLVLLLHEHPSLTNDEAAAVVDLSARQVQRWRSRWAGGDFSVDDRSGRGRKATFFPPLDQALIQAMACEVVAETKLPLSRQSLADLVGRAQATWAKRSAVRRCGGCCMKQQSSPGSTNTGSSHGMCSLPRRPGRSWTCTRACGKASRWGRQDYVLSMDEKTSIQARGRKHEEMPPEPNRLGG